MQLACDPWAQTPVGALLSWVKKGNQMPRHDHQLVMHCEWMNEIPYHVLMV